MFVWSEPRVIARSNYNNYKLLSDLSHYQQRLLSISLVYPKVLILSTSLNMNIPSIDNCTILQVGGNKNNNTKSNTLLTYIAPFLTSSISQLREENWWFDFLMREIKHLLHQPALIVYIRDFLILISNYAQRPVRDVRCEVVVVVVVVCSYIGQINITITVQDNDRHHLDKWILI